MTAPSGSRTDQELIDKFYSCIDLGDDPLNIPHGAITRANNSGTSVEKLTTIAYSFFEEARRMSKVAPYSEPVDITAPLHLTFLALKRFQDESLQRYQRYIPISFAAGLTVGIIGTAFYLKHKEK